MSDRQPVILLTFLESAARRWSVASIDAESRVRPLIQSQTGDLDDYVDMTFDEQVSFLRHRIAGALQRGADRLWPRNQKATLFVVGFESSFAESESVLIRTVSENFVNWMMRPPAVCFCDGWIAGNIEERESDVVIAALPTLISMIMDTEAWETIPKKKRP